MAEPGQVFVRADLGQIEPRVLAVVSGDRAFAEATRADDLYAPVAAKLGIERKVAKVAVLAAMYGQRSGAAGRALGDLERAYPVAMGLLDDAYASGVARRPLRTFGGRRINLDAAWAGSDDGGRGRFARNAVIQGSAAELFKAWAATVRHVDRARWALRSCCASTTSCCCRRRRNAPRRSPTPSAAAWTTAPAGGRAPRTSGSSPTPASSGAGPTPK